MTDYTPLFEDPDYDSNGVLTADIAEEADTGHVVFSHMIEQIMAMKPELIFD